MTTHQFQYIQTGDRRACPKLQRYNPNLAHDGRLCEEIKRLCFPAEKDLSMIEAGSRWDRPKFTVKGLSQQYTRNKQATVRTQIPKFQKHRTETH
ncbi:hypothetical protein BY458DRAFT_441483 [Sporodiniella umbellata]|nr:hypothetical protein BY458DRAFT_441483 [Sporodiniella umbellata]